MEEKEKKMTVGGKRRRRDEGVGKLPTGVVLSIAKNLKK